MVGKQGWEGIRDGCRGKWVWREGMEMRQSLEEAEIGKGVWEEPLDPRMREWFGFPAPPLPCGKEDFIKRWKSENRETSESNSPPSPNWAPLPEFGN